jgi:hypothetical protein
MATLAPKLPYTHPFAGGYPYRGSQRLPSDPDALTYLAAVAAADGAPVEVGVATAVDDFFKGCKADPSGTPGRSNWDAIKASCILAGARTLAGALVPLKNEGPELVDIDNLPTPTVYQLSGSSGEWNASTSTMVNTTGESSSYPRFLFYFPGVVTGKTYAVSGRLSGDTTHVSNIRGGSSGDLASINTATGEFAATLTVGGSAGFNVLFNGQSAPTSVTIDSLSIREVIAAPTNVADGFVSGDYTRGGATPGLKGDGTSYLDSGRANDDDLEDDNHNVLWGSTLSVTGIEMGAGSNGVGANNVSQQVSAAVARSRTTSFAQLTRVDVPMLFGHSRSSAGEFKVRYNGATTTEIFASESPSSDNVFLFCRNNGSGTPEQFSPSRIAFYSIGESLDLALLDARVTALVTAIGAAV